jgi:hypothetical protein
MSVRCATVLAAVIGAAVAGAATAAAAAATAATPAAQEYRIDDVASARLVNVQELKPATVAFSDKPDGGGDTSALGLARFADWAKEHAIEKKFLALYPSYAEPTIAKADDPGGKPHVQKLYMYVAQARFVLDQAPGAIDLAHHVTLDFLNRIDPAIKHKPLAAGKLGPFTGERGTGNANPNRPWCTGRQALICIQSSYKLEGKIPLGILLINKLRDTVKKISDHIDFQSEFSALAPADLDQAGLQQLTKLDTPVDGVLVQDIFYVNQIMKFGKFFAVFQNHPTDPGKTVVTAFMALAIDASVFDKKAQFEHIPVLRNLVPAEVLMGRSSFNSGRSISAGLPEYARNEIKTVAGLLESNVATK